MIIKGFHIDNFGIFKDHDIDGLKPGINVICGNNESGKTTLGEFIKRTLFKHYDRRSSHNTYAIDGASPGGSLFCFDRSCGDFTITRAGTRNGGSVTVIRDGETGGTEILNELLPLSEYFYRNIYAITIEELHSADFMNNEELRSRLFSAGLETGTVSLTQLRKDLNGEMDELFKRAGEKNRMYKLGERANELKAAISEVEAMIANADKIRGELDDVVKVAAAAGSGLNTLRLELAQLEQKKGAYEAWVQLNMMRDKLASMPDVSTFPVDGVARLVELKSAVRHASELHEKNRAQCAKISVLLDNLPMDDAILDESEDIIALYRDIQSHRERLRRQEKLSSDIRELQNELAHSLSSLGNGWNESSIAEFKGGKLLRERIRDLGDRISGLEREQETARAVANASRSGNDDSSRILKWLAGIIAIIGGGVVMLMWSLTEGIIVILAVLVYSLITSRNKVKVNGSGENSAPIESGLNKAQEELALLLEHNGLQRDLASGGALIFLDEVEACTGLFNRLNRMRTEHGELEVVVNAFCGKYEKLCGRLKREISGDPAVGAEMLYEALTKAREENLKRQSARENLVQVRTDLDASEKQLEQASLELAELLKGAKAEDEDEFRKLADVVADREAVKDRITALDSAVRSRCADGDYDSFVLQLREFSPDSAMILEQEINEKIAASERELELVNRNIGTLQEQLRSIEDNPQIEKDRTELDSCLKQLHQLSREWTRLRVALHLLDAAIARYERERRPGVIDAAAKYFRELTDGAYVDILQKLEDDTIVVNAADGSVRQVDELSRGTREELLLCLRLGVVTEFEKNSGSMPLILDDVLVDFDNPRRETAVKMLTEFASGRQLIIMSCHRETVELYRQSGANIIPFGTFSGSSR